jgi:hypothetical protein
MHLISAVLLLNELLDVFEVARVGVSERISAGDLVMGTNFIHKVRWHRSICLDFAVHYPFVLAMRRTRKVLGSKRHSRDEATLIFGLDPDTRSLL